MPDKPSINIIPKQKEKEPIWVSIVLIVGILLLLAIFIPYFISKNRVDELEQNKVALESQITTLVNEYKGMSRDLIDTARRVNDFSDIFEEHRITTKIFELLSEATHPLVQLTSFGFSEEESKELVISISVVTENFRTLGEQFLAFQENQDIKEPDLSNIALDKDGLVNAEFRFYLDKSFITPFSLK